VPVRTSSSRQLARAAPGSALIQFCFHFDICLRATLDMARPHHHGAVGGFFSAPQDRAASTSFEGGNKVARCSTIASEYARDHGK
jgi:hypothetical protein